VQLVKEDDGYCRGRVMKTEKVVAAAAAVVALPCAPTHEEAPAMRNWIISDKKEELICGRRSGFSSGGRLGQGGTGGRLRVKPLTIAAGSRCTLKTKSWGKKKDSSASSAYKSSRGVQRLQQNKNGRAGLCLCVFVPVNHFPLGRNSSARLIDIFHLHNMRGLICLLLGKWHSPLYTQQMI